MEKAYDRMEWGFIVQVLKKFSFSSQWISKMQRCWEDIWFSVIINGRSFSFFKSSRGLRLSNVRILLRFITQYENASGQKVNSAKTSIIVPKNCSRTKVQKLNNITGYKQGFLPFMYLGVPLSKGRIPAPQLQQLVQKITRRIDGWKAKLLNQAAKLVLIKHVLSSVPIHMLAAINIPKSVAKAINRVIANFFWGSSDKGNKKHWVKWQLVCTHILEGGLGIRSFEDISRAFRIKMGWNLLQGRSLWAKFTSARYFLKTIASNGVNGHLSSSS